jgi:hypothetical protein
MRSRHAIGFDPTARDLRVPPAEGPVPITARHQETRGPRVPITRSLSVDQMIIAKLIESEITQKLAAGDV